MSLFGFIKQIGTLKNHNTSSSKKNNEITNDEFWAEMNRQITAKEAQREATKAASDLTDPEVNGKKRSYQYKDVEINVIWQYGGRYGKTLEDIGVRRGSPLILSPDPQPEDPFFVSVFFGTTKIGSMPSNRMRNMVYQWAEKGYPVVAVAASVGGEYKLLSEISFYGYVRK